MSKAGVIKSLPARLRQAREGARLSQTAFAGALEVSRTAVQNWESGNDLPTLTRFPRIAEVTGKPEDWFFQDEGAAEPAGKAPSNPLQKEEPVSGPDTHALLAQLVAAQTQMLQAQARAEERQAEMSQALAALAHDRLESRAEAARTSARLTQVEEGLRAMLEAPRGGCGEDEATLAG